MRQNPKGTPDVSESSSKVGFQGHVIKKAKILVKSDPFSRKPLLLGFYRHPHTSEILEIVTFVDFRNSDSEIRNFGISEFLSIFTEKGPVLHGKKGPRGGGYMHGGVGGGRGFY